MVRLFYERGLADDVLGPIFRAAIHDWDAHIPIVASFWSSMIHGTQRYRGQYASACTLKAQVRAGGRSNTGLSTFESAANEALEPDDAAKATRIARHMAQSFKVGLFPFAGPDGKAFPRKPSNDR
jgi:hemoglobin